MKINNKRALFEVGFLTFISIVCYIYFMVPEQSVRYHNGLDFVKNVKELVFG